MTEQKPTKILMKGIEILDVKIIQPEQPLQMQTVFQFNLNIEHKVNPDKKLVIVIANITVLNDDKKSELGAAKISSIFEISDFETYTDNEKKQVKFPDNILKELNNTAISTSRGVMFGLFKGTFLHNAVLPMIDSETFSKR